MKKKIYELSRTWTSRLMIAALASGLFAACSDSDDGPLGGDLPNFENVADAEPGKTYERTGTAASTWTVTSSASNWCTVSPATGGKGNFKLTITVTDTDWNFEDDNEATITFAYSGTDQSTSFKVTRPAKPIVSTFKYDDGKETTDFVITENAQGVYTRRLTVVNNFDWTLDESSLPDWLEPVSASGSADQEVNVWLTVIPDKMDTEGASGEMKFLLNSTKVNKNTTLPVKYGTLAGNYFNITLSSNITNYTANAGAQFIITDRVGGEVDFWDGVPFAVASVPEVAFYAIEFDNASSYQEPDYTGVVADWLFAEPAQPSRAPINGGNYEMKVAENSGGMRSGQLFAMPASVKAQISSPTDLVDDEGILKEEYKKYLVLSVTQMGGDNMIVLEVSTAYSTVIDFYHAASKGEFTLEELKDEYNTENVYILEAENIEEGQSVSYQIRFMDYLFTNDMFQYVSPAVSDPNVISTFSFSALSGQYATGYLYPKYNDTGAEREANVRGTFNDDMAGRSELMGVVIFRQGS